jgi:hypothetical protein
MDIEGVDGEGTKVKLGVVERRVLSGAFALLVFLLGYVFHNFDSRLEEQGKSMAAMATQQAVTNSQLQTLSQQLADVPGLTQRVVELRVQVDRNTADIHDLQSKGAHR